jgi:hypothetical protein
MLRLSVEELIALNTILNFTTVTELLTAAMHGFAEDEKQLSQEVSDLCWKMLKTLNQR